MREVVVSYNLEHLRKRLEDNTVPTIDSILKSEWYTSVTKTSADGDRIALMVTADQENLIRDNVGDKCRISDRVKLVPI